METPLHRRLYTAAQSRELDRIAGSKFGLHGDALMERAGAAALLFIRETWPAAKTLAVACGTGNNGGDGFVLARLASETGMSPTVFLTGEPSSLKNEAARAFTKLAASNVPVRNAGEAPFEPADAVVDAIFGTGLKREVTGAAVELIRKINASRKPVLSLDVPSGLCADTGRVLGVSVKAAATVSFIGLKRGLFTAEGPDQAGKISLADLGIPPEAHECLTPSAELLDLSAESSKLAARAKNAHKGLYGHVLVIGGAAGMTGAALLCGEAALRSGAGLVSLAIPEPGAVLIAEKRPELMVSDATELKVLKGMIGKAGVVAIGPGLGVSPWAKSALAAALAAEKPLVVDADALNLSADSPARRESWVLTPHPGEASKLLNLPMKEIQADRFAAARALQSRYGGVIILKGCGSLVCSDASSPIGVCADGNPGMASGGMGDALTGVIAALMAQNLSPADAARLGVCAHARAGDLAAGQAPRGLIATDLIKHLREVLNF